MYYIITNEPEDELVMKGVNQLISDFESPIPSSNGNYIFITLGNEKKGGNGGTRNQLVIIGHANENGISGYKTFKSYWEDVTKNNPNLYPKTNKDTVVFLIACSAAGVSKIKFKNLNIAEEFKSGLKVETLWASTTSVNLNFKGDWEKV